MASHELRLQIANNNYEYYCNPLISWEKIFRRELLSRWTPGLPFEITVPSEYFRLVLTILLFAAKNRQGRDLAEALKKLREILANRAFEVGYLYLRLHSPPY